MSGITVLSANPALETTLVDLYGRSMAVRRAWSDRWRDADEVAWETCADDPDLVVIGSDIRQEQVLAIVEALQRSFPTTTVLCLVADLDVEYSMHLLRQGSRDVIVEKGPSDEFRAEIDPVIRIARDRSAGAGPGANRFRRVITVISPKGGTGKTTVSTNLAALLARHRAGQVVLLDLDVQFGDCAPALGLIPRHGLIDAIDGLGHRPSTLKAFLVDHPSGLALLSPPDDLVAVEQIEPEQLDRVLTSATEEFAVDVVDTARGVDAASLAAIERATDLLLVSTPDAPSIRATRRQLDTLDQLGYTWQRRTLVLNRADAKGGLTVAAVEAALGLEAAFQIPASRLIAAATNEGVPVVAGGTGTAAGRSFERLAGYLVPEQDRVDGFNGDRRKRFRGRRPGR